MITFTADRSQFRRLASLAVSAATGVETEVLVADRCDLTLGRYKGHQVGLLVLWQPKLGAYQMGLAFNGGPDEDITVARPNVLKTMPWTRKYKTLRSLVEAAGCTVVSGGDT